MKARAPRTIVAFAAAVTGAVALLWLLGSTTVPGRAAPATPRDDAGGGVCVYMAPATISNCLV